MSHLTPVALKLKCSLGVLEQCIKKIMPEWEKNIKTDPNSGLVCHGMGDNYPGSKDFEGCSLVIPRSSPGLRYCDLGFKKGENGDWQAIVDPQGIPNSLSNIENVLKKSLAEIRVEEILADPEIDALNVAKETAGKKTRIRFFGRLPSRAIEI